MRLLVRDIDIEKDKKFILDSHCKINFACDSDWVIKTGYDVYAEKWYSTRQPNEFLNTLIESKKDIRTIAKICELHDECVGYIWVTFTDVPDYKFIIAEINDIFISEKWQNKGFATDLIQYVEAKCKEFGANVLRSGTSVENIASISLHEKLGFKKYRVELEKLL